MNWESMIINLPDQKVGRPIIITYKYIGENPERISQNNIIPGCACSNPSWNAYTKELKVTFTPNPIPFHLTQQGWYNSTKHITVNYGNGSDKLEFNCKVTR